MRNDVGILKFEKMSGRRSSIDTKPTYIPDAVDPEQLQKGLKILGPQRSVPLFDHFDKSSEEHNPFGLPRYLNVKDVNNNIGIE